jgi:hypothetical protein
LIRHGRTDLLVATVTLLVLAVPATAGSKHSGAQMPMPAEETIDDCQQRYAVLRKDAERKADPIRGMREHPLAKDEFCKALADYEEAQLKILGFVDVNAKRCGLPPQFHQQLIKTYAATTAVKDKTCPKPRMRFG